MLGKANSQRPKRDEDEGEGLPPPPGGIGLARLGCRGILGSLGFLGFLGVRLALGEHYRFGTYNWRYRGSINTAVWH